DIPCQSSLCPPSSSVSPGGTVSLACTTQSSYPIGWYQQKEGEAPRFVHCDGWSRGEGIPDRLTATRSGSTGSLTITNAEAEDEADYYCDNPWPQSPLCCKSSL
uniref:Ig-like domain-containing protein n=1 Tax=Pseudonaja textilis TaxID=8673 RepID=A0A670Z8X1_PSETE